MNRSDPRPAGQAIEDVAERPIVGGVPHSNAARAFLDIFMGRPEPHGAFTGQMKYDTSNRGAVKLLPPPERKTSVTAAENWRRPVRIGNSWLVANLAMLTERWNSWLAA